MSLYLLLNRSQALRHIAPSSRSFANILPSSRLIQLTASQYRSLSTEARAAIDQAVSSNNVVLFMKGTPEMPQCGFSRASIQILGLQGVDPKKFAAFNVLEDESLRQGTLHKNLVYLKILLNHMCRHKGVLRLAYDTPALRGQGVCGRV